MGEQTVRLLLEEWLPAKTAAEAAADWGGDRIRVFSDDARSRWAVGWHVRFDNEIAAKRGFSAFARSAPLTERGHDPRQLPGAAPPASSDRLCRARHSQGPLALVRRGSDLAVAIGPFQRSAATVDKDLDCAAALRWAAQIVTN
jgi:hypothetical protein